VVVQQQPQPQQNLAQQLIAQAKVPSQREQALKQLRQLWEKEIEQEQGQSYLQAHKALLDAQWEVVESLL